MAYDNVIYADLEDSGSSNLGTRAEPYNTTADVEANITDSTQLIFTGTSPQYLDPLNNGIAIPDTNKLLITTDLDEMIVSGWIDLSGETFTQYGATDIWYFDLPDTNSKPGGVYYEGAMLGWIEFDTDIATTAASIIEGTSSVDFAVEQAGYRIYVHVTGDVDPTGDDIRSTGSGAFSCVAGGTDLVIKNLIFEGYGRSAIRVANWKGFEVYDNTIRWCGGDEGFGSVVVVGSGVTVYGTTTNGRIHDNTIYEIFDSPTTLQNFDGSAHLISNIRIDHNTIDGGALAAVELANWGGGVHTQDNIEIDHNTITGIGGGWGGIGDAANNTHGIVLTAGSTTVRIFTNIHIHDNTIDGDLSGATGWGIRLKNAPGGANVIFERNLVTNFTTGFELFTTVASVSTLPVVRANIITDCTTGIYHDDTISAGSATYQWNTIRDCTTAVHIFDTNGTPDLNKNSIETATTGVLLAGGKTVNNTYNNVFSGGTNFSGLSADATDTEVDPLTILGAASGQVTDSVHISPYSPLYQAGDADTGHDYYGHPYTSASPSMGAVEHRDGGVVAKDGKVPLVAFTTVSTWT